MINRLEIYGDSLLKGITYSTELAKYRLVGNYFEKLRECGIEVHNHSHMGATVAKGYSILQRTLCPCDSHTLVLFDYGGNDCDYDWEAVTRDPDSEYLPFTPENEFTRIYRDAVRYAREAGAIVAVASLVPIDSGKYMNWISRNRSYDNILHWLGDVSMLGRWHEHYNNLAAGVASETECPIVDFRSEFLTSRHYQTVICPDGIHPTDLGYGMMEDKLLRFIRECA